MGLLGPCFKSGAIREKIAHVLDSRARVPRDTPEKLAFMLDFGPCFVTATMEETKKTRFSVCHRLGAWGLVDRTWRTRKHKRGHNTRQPTRETTERER